MTETTKSPAGLTLDQRRARHAWEAVQRAKQKQGAHEKQDPKKFGGQVKKLPTRIMAAGLGQALAFLKAKDYAPGLLAELTEWMRQRIPPSKENRPICSNESSEAIRTSSVGRPMRYWPISSGSIASPRPRD
jgi:CRISPR-associated protein Cmr5